jgi:hypothetical protein
MTFTSALIILSPFLFACIPALIWHERARRLADGNAQRIHRAPSTGEGDAPPPVAPFAGGGALSWEADHAA